MKQTLKQRALMLFAVLMTTASIYAQQVITGTVTDNMGPLVGATVVVKDAKVPTGTVTDNDGKYTITVPNKKSILIFSYVGYSDQVVIVGN